MPEVDVIKNEVNNLKERLQELKQDVQTMRAEMKADLASLETKVATISDFVSAAKGGKAILFGLLTLAASLGAALTYFSKVFHG